jgi:hypothetical protein
MLKKCKEVSLQRIKDVATSVNNGYFRTRQHCTENRWHSSTSQTPVKADGNIKVGLQTTMVHTEGEQDKKQINMNV